MITLQSIIKVQIRRKNIRNLLRHELKIMQLPRESEIISIPVWGIPLQLLHLGQVTQLDGPLHNYSNMLDLRQIYNCVVLWLFPFLPHHACKR